jgi:hypothetical protein
LAETQHAAAIAGRGDQVNLTAAARRGENATLDSKGVAAGTGLCLMD